MERRNFQGVLQHHSSTSSHPRILSPSWLTCIERVRLRGMQQRSQQLSACSCGVRSNAKADSEYTVTAAGGIVERAAPCSKETKTRRDLEFSLPAPLLRNTKFYNGNPWLKFKIQNLNVGNRKPSVQWIWWVCRSLPPREQRFLRVDVPVLVGLYL